MQLPVDVLIDALFEANPDPVLVVNGAGVVVAANPASATLLGYEQAELVDMDGAGLGLTAAGEGGQGAGTSGSGAGDRWRHGQARMRCKDGRLLSVELVQLPSGTPSTTPAATVFLIRNPVVLGSDSEFAGRVGQLELNAPFKAALDAVSIGFAIYDQDDRLVLFNDAYRTMNRAFTAAIEIGKTFETIVRDALQTGLYPEAGATPESREAWIADRLDHHNRPREPHVLKVGESQWIQIEDRVTADSHRVSLRADVSALMAAKSEAERLGFILEGVAQEIYLIKPQSRSIVYANRAARDNLQYSSEELRAIDVRLLNADYSPDELSEKMRPLLSGEIKVLSMDTRHRRKDGTTYVCRVRLERLGEHRDNMTVLSFGEDITERLVIENALERRRTEFEVLVRSLPDLITRAEPDTTLTYVNENYAKFIGVKAEDMVGRKFLDFIPPKARRRVVRKIAGLTPQKPMKTEERWTTDHAGRDHWYSWTNLMVFDDGRPTELVSVGRDISESYQARERIAQQTRELASRNDALQQFAGVVSHDLKAPLRQVRLFAEMIAEDIRNGKTDELDVLSAYVSDRAKSMEQMISSLLEFSQLAYRSINASRFRLSDAVKVAWDNLAVHAEEAGATLYADADTEIVADFALIVQLLQNLFANSMKYRRVETPVEVRLDVKTGASSITIAVEDNGIGIDPGHSDKIFGVFQRLHRDERHYSGTGLGLALCRRIAESHGGSIVLDPAVRQGARFITTLPRRRT